MCPFCFFAMTLRIEEQVDNHGLPLYQGSLSLSFYDQREWEPEAGDCTQNLHSGALI